VIALKHVAKVIAGQSPPSTDVTDFLSGLPFLQGNAEFSMQFPNPRYECSAPPKRSNAGDILLSVRAPVGALNVSDRPYGIGRGLCAIRATNCDSRFLWWWLHSQRSNLDSVSTGSTYTAVTAEQVSNLDFPVMELGKQRRIADFLDAETARIDRSANLRRLQLALLVERLWSKFVALTGACETNHLPLRRLVHHLVDGPFGSAFSSDDYSESGAAVVRLGNIGFAEYRSDEQVYIPLSLFERFRQHDVLPGDLLIAGLGDANNHAGRACVAPDLRPAMVKGKCFRGRVDPRVASAEFVSFMMSSPIGRDAFESRGSTRSMINLELVRSAVFPIPSVADQISIADEMISYRLLEQKARSAVELGTVVLAERRQALITAAVTGQFDVTTGRGVDLS
jgi:type I restriction enzyme, S subunit